MGEIRRKPRPGAARWPVLLAAALGAATAHADGAAAPGPAEARPGGGADPPIDCPLHKGGVDPQALRPFAETEQYIAHLDRPDREAWQRPDAVIAALGLRGTERVADLGAGSGYFTFRLARALPRGRVQATDVDPEMVRHLHHRVMAEGVSNVQVALARPDDPGIPPGTDLAFVCDVLHHVAARDAWLRRAFDELPPGARLVVIEFKEGPLPQGPPEAMKIPRARLVAQVEAAGFRLAAEDAALLPYQRLLTFTRPAR